MFVEMPFTFVFPWEIFLLTFVLSVGVALASACVARLNYRAGWCGLIVVRAWHRFFPAKALIKETIANVVKGRGAL